MGLVSLSLALVSMQDHKAHVIRSWGNQSLSLQLPALSVNLQGLTTHQRETLSNAYQSYLCEPDDCDITSYMSRLESMPDIDQNDITIDGQYALKIDRTLNTSMVQVTGVNFIATISDGLKAKESNLSVINEEDLVSPIVFENYLRVLAAHYVLKQGGLLLHSAGLIIDGAAYLFPGFSNAGKTTLARKAFDQNILILSDDINLVLPSKGGYEAYAVPFSGEFGSRLDPVVDEKYYPLAGIAFLKQGERLETECVDPPFAFSHLLTTCPFVNKDEHEFEALFDAVSNLLKCIPTIQLISRKDDDVTDIIEAVRQQFESREN